MSPTLRLVALATLAVFSTFASAGCTSTVRWPAPMPPSGEVQAWSGVTERGVHINARRIEWRTEHWGLLGFSYPQENLTPVLVSVRNDTPATLIIHRTGATLTHPRGLRTAHNAAEVWDAHGKSLDVDIPLFGRTLVWRERACPERLLVPSRGEQVCFLFFSEPPEAPTEERLQIDLRIDDGEPTPATVNLPPAWAPESW